MKSIIMRIVLFSIFLFFLTSLPAYSATERRTALVIGNSDYSTGSLRNPVNDSDDMDATLKRLGFDVILKKNATQQDMEDAIRDFGARLKKGGVGLFFYAGHGVQISGKNFLLPIGARIDRETDVKYRAVDADMVLDEMGNAGNAMNIVILDACRDNPFRKTFRTASRGLAIISSAPRGTLVSYSTGPGNVAADGNGRNSPYTASLMKHMITPGLQIEDVFKNVRQDLGRMTGGKQLPWELSSLEGRFYFNDQTGGGRDKVEASKRLDDERQRIAQERELLEKQSALEEERRKIEALRSPSGKGTTTAGTPPIERISPAAQDGLPKQVTHPQAERLYIRIFRLKFASIDRVQDILKSIAGVRTIRIHEPTKTVMMEDTLENIDKIEKALQSLDRSPHSP